MILPAPSLTGACHALLAVCYLYTEDCPKFPTPQVEVLLVPALVA